MATFETINTDRIALDQARADLVESTTALAARIALDRTRGAADIEELWRLVRLARTLGA
jgi:hypothetical protein